MKVELREIAATIDRLRSTNIDEIDAHYSYQIQR